MKDAACWIEKLDMQKHPEGGWFKECYRSEEMIKAAALPLRFREDHCFATAIYFLLEQEEFSAFHRINQDETWHHYAGAPVRLHLISPVGDYSTRIVGSDPQADIFPQYTVRAGWLFAAEVEGNGPYTLAGCTVAPGFLFSDFEMPGRAELLAAYPQHEAAVVRLSRSGG
jgi:hypothetical protein